MIRWGRNHNALPREFDPYAGRSLPATPPKHLSEATLPTDDEILALLKHAGADLADLIRFYLAVGCRTGDALKATVGSFNARSRTVVLAEHKTATKTSRTRQIVLNEAAYEIMARRCRGKDADDLIFTKRDGRPWRMNNLSHHWQALREKAGVRETVTPYSLRHLWASDAIESGLDLSTVAKMMGSSTAVVERYYAHFRTTRLQEAHNVINRHRTGRGLSV
jgi:integrase